MQIELKNYKNHFILILFGVGISVLFNILFQFIVISGESMQPTYNNGNIVVISKYNKAISYNDIIVFINGNEKNIKRVIAIPNDKIELKNNGIYINSVKINPYTYNGINKTYILTDDEYFVIGDNYLDSYDSRNYGPITKNKIIGKILFTKNNSS